MGYLFKRTNPTFTNLSAVQPNTIVPRVGGNQKIGKESIKGRPNGYQLRKEIQPPRHAAVAADPGFDPGRNSGGGYSWQVDDWTRLDRFLILGAEGGTYYIAERELVKQNHDATHPLHQGGRCSRREPHR